MAQLVIREGVKGGFEARGAALDLWRYRGFECVLAGPAETGKTWSCCQKVDAMLWKYPGAQGVMLRKVYGSLIGSAMQTYKRIIGFDSGHCPIKAYGGEKPEWFDYPNGSRLWVIGLDNPGKALSSERDFFYVNQAEELSLDDWQTLVTRCTGRGSVMPYTQILGDCNPGPPTHWILQRESLKVLHSRHEDNPTLYDDGGQITEQGKKSLSILDSLTGVLYQRLRLGKWVKAEGAVYEQFLPAEHVLSRQQLIAKGVFNQDGTLNWNKVKRVEGAQDWGYSNPGVMLLAAIDGDGRRYVFYEVYYSRKLIEWWCDKLVTLVKRWGMTKIACDPAEPAFIRAYREALSRAGIQCEVIEAENAILSGIQTVQGLLCKQPDDTYGLYFFADMLEDRDEELVKQKQPTTTLQELDLYAYPKGADGKPVKELPVDMFNHGADTLRYLCAKSGSEPASVARVNSRPIGRRFN